MNAILRPAEDRGHADYGWLDTWHSFSFANYYDARHMGFRTLRVINDDVIRPGTGFPTHGHRDMEIITYMVRGTLTHQDNTGGNGVLRRSDIQVMSAGTGIRHSEFNASKDEDIRLLQIWILPSRDGLPPSYNQHAIIDSDRSNRLALIAGPSDTAPILSIHQDARIYSCLLEHGHEISHRILPGRGIWLQVVDGTISIASTTLRRGDGLAIENKEQIDIRTETNCEFLLFDLA